MSSYDRLKFWCFAQSGPFSNPLIILSIHHHASSIQVHIAEVYIVFRRVHSQFCLLLQIHLTNVVSIDYSLCDVSVALTPCALAK